MNILHNQNQKLYHLDANTAESVLQNVLSSCNYEPSTIPFELLVIKDRPNLLLVDAGIILSALLFVLMLVFPCLGNLF